jgi:hypothetical protein
MSAIRIHFEDKGQDFTWWEVDAETGLVVDCGPCQAWAWVGQWVYLPSIKRGCCPLIWAAPAIARRRGDRPLVLAHRVERIEPARAAA